MVQGELSPDACVSIQMDSVQAVYTVIVLFRFLYVFMERMHFLFDFRLGGVPVNMH
jgi:hypothetical protein